MQYFGRTNICAGSAACTFGVIYHRNAVNHFHALFRAVFNAEFAFNAAGFAVFCYHGFVHVQIGTYGPGAFLIPGNRMNDVHGTFGNTGLAAIAFIVINFGEIVFQAQGVKFTNRDTVAKALAAPDTALDAARCNFRGPAAFNTGIFPPVYNFVAAAAAGQNRCHGL